MLEIDINSLQFSTILTKSDGIIKKVNTRFFKKLGWTGDNLVGERIETIIPNLFINHENHIRKIDNYDISKNSNVVGKNRIFPVRKGDDNIILMEIAIYPITQGNSYNYICFFTEIENETKCQDDSFNQIIHYFEKVYDGIDNFRQNTEANNFIVSFILRYLEYEMKCLLGFIKDNNKIKDSWKMLDYLIFQQKYGKLSKFYEMLLLKTQNTLVIYSNIVCMRILFPILSSDPLTKKSTIEYSKELWKRISINIDASIAMNTKREEQKNYNESVYSSQRSISELSVNSFDSRFENDDESLTKSNKIKMSRIQLPITTKFPSPHSTPISSPNRSPNFGSSNLNPNLHKMNEYVYGNYKKNMKKRMSIRNSKIEIPKCLSEGDASYLKASDLMASDLMA
jgi:PAS domain S-box-containing protein